jgi:hypothetical protein
MSLGNRKKQTLKDKGIAQFGKHATLIAEFDH